MASDEYAATAVSRMIDRIPASLYEVAWQYSLLDWYDAMQSGDIDWDLAPEHLAYLTPRAQSDLFGEDDSLIVVYADLSDPANPTLRSASNGGPVEITTYTERDRFRVGHAYPENKTSSMTDYSITTQKSADAHHLAGLRDDAWGTNNVQDRFTGWAQSEYAKEVREDATEDDAKILEALAELGDDEAEMEHLSDEFLNLAGDEDEEFEALITVRVRLPGESEYKFPGEIPVLNDVMVAKKDARLQSVSVDDASGEGTGYVTEEDESVTGGSPGLFGMYGKKQREHIPDLDTQGSAAWRNRPLSFDVAAAIAAAGSIFEDFYRGFRSNRRLYVLPYLADRKDGVEPETFTWFYRTVFQPLRDADRGPDGTFDEELERIVQESNGTVEEPEESEPFSDAEDPSAWDRVRFAIVLQVTGNPDRVFFDTLDGTYYPARLDDAHNRVTASSEFSDDGIFATNPSPESSPLLGTPLRLTQSILYGFYFSRTTEPTRSSREAEETPTAGDVDDYRMSRVRNLLTGEQIAQQPLLEHYIHQIVQDQHELFDDDGGYVAFPVRSVVEQYAQLRALTDADVLDRRNSDFHFTTIMTDDQETRSDRLETFLEDHHALEAESHRAVFLLGGLVGRITAYQEYQDVSSTLVRRYPVDYLTQQTIKEVTKEVLQMNNSYAEADEDRSYLTNQRYTSRLADSMLSADPSNWSMTQAELQWLYSLGIAYGINDTSIDIETEESETAATPTNS